VRFYVNETLEIGRYNKQVRRGGELKVLLTAKIQGTGCSGWEDWIKAVSVQNKKKQREEG
jgi:hypothetical protein